MDKSKSIILALTLAVMALFSFKQYEQATPKETMTIIVSEKGTSMLVEISVTGSKSSFEQKRIKAASEHNYTGALEIMKVYQDQGWQIKNSNYATSVEPDSDHHTYLYFLLEK